MGLVIQILLQLTILVVAMIIASLILRWILANPEKCKAAWMRFKKLIVTPFIRMRAFKAYRNWKRVGMEFSYQECLNIEWQKYEGKQHPDQPYYRL